MSDKKIEAGNAFTFVCLLIATVGIFFLGDVVLDNLREEQLQQQLLEEENYCLENNGNC